MTCCLIDQLNGKLIVQAIGSEEREGKRIFHLKGVFDRTPPSFTDRAFRYLGYLELCEKIAEIVDETFHLFGPLFERYTNLMVYQMTCNLHHGAHDIEHVLHSFCFLGDVTRLLSGKFLEYEQEKINYLRSASRVCHAIAHFLSTIKFLNELKLCRLGPLEKIVKYTSVFSLLGHALWTVSLLWRRHQKTVDKQFTSDMLIHGGGLLFEAFLLAKSVQSLASYTSLLNKAASLAGIIHAIFFAQRLMPKDREKVRTEFIIPEGFFNQDIQPENHSNSKCNGYHLHKHKVQFYSV